MVPFASTPPFIDHIEQIQIAAIIVGKRLRPLSESVVEELANSMKEIGLVCPITIRRPHGQLVPHLVAGAHRLAAAKKLGWDEIPCVVAPPEDDDRAALMEIDENLMRGELSPAERAVHIDERKAIYERLHPQTQHGAVGAMGGKKIQTLDLFPMTPQRRPDAPNRLWRRTPRERKRSRKSSSSSAPRSTRVKSLMR